MPATFTSAGHTEKHIERREGRKQISAANATYHVKNIKRTPAGKNEKGGTGE
jgi:hypothetical protein